METSSDKLVGPRHDVPRNLLSTNTPFPFITSLDMPHSDYTDDETEYDSPSHSQAVVMVGLALSL